MIADKTKHIHFQKERKFPFLLPISILPLSSQSAQPFQPLATWAEACQAIPVVSAWVMNTVRRGYSLQFDRRPPSFCGVLATSVRSEDAHVLRGDESAGKWSHRNHSSSPEQFRLLQLLLPRPQIRWWPTTYYRSQTPELRSDVKVVQDDHFETDPLAITM